MYSCQQIRLYIEEKKVFLPPIKLYMSKTNQYVKLPKKRCHESKYLYFLGEPTACLVFLTDHQSKF
jgi:hypothetical protein